jgi:hypothetical protein
MEAVRMFLHSTKIVISNREAVRNLAQWEKISPGTARQGRCQSPQRGFFEMTVKIIQSLNH